MLDLTIIVVNYNNAQDLAKCLESVYRNTHKIKFEIILVDNHSTDHSLEIVKSKYPKVRLIENKQNLGFAKANNQGLAIYQSRYALLLNTDTLVQDSALDRLVEFMDARPQAGAAGPKLLNPDGTLQHQGGFFAKKFWQAKEPIKVDFVTGACFLVRREVIEKVGGLDENFFFGNDDLDWCRRIRKAGWEIYFIPQAEVTHYGGFTTKKFNKRIFVEGFRGGLYFARKHYGNVVYQLYRFLLALSMLIAAFFSLLIYPFLKNKQKLVAFWQIFLICLKGELLRIYNLKLKTLLFLSNGHGEDLVADKIIEHLDGNFEIIKLPLVDTALPSGGFSLRNWRFLKNDLAAGLLGSTFKNIKTLRNLRGRVSLTVAIGDIVPIIGALIVGAPFLFVGVNKTDYYRSFGFSYTPWEKWLLKKYAKKIFTRDELTAKHLNNENISAEYVGNPLMDCLTPLTQTYPPSPSKMERGMNSPTKSEKKGVRIGFLPGTRDDAKLNLEDFEKIVALLPKEYRFLAATTLPEIPPPLERKPFAEVLAESDLIVGLSGTGNEQAAGSGLPVVSFYGRGSQYNKKFAQAQKELLGEAIELVNSNDLGRVVSTVKFLLKDRDRMEKIGKTGQERMGERGAANKISKYITEILANKLQGEI